MNTRDMTPAQIGVILGLESFLQMHQLILTCPRCLKEGHPQLVTDNQPGHAEWKIDCGCTHRRIASSDAGRAQDADGDLIFHAPAVLEPMNLVIRCAEPTCLQHPLQVYRDRDRVIVSCRCAKTTLRPLTPTVH